MRQNTQVSIYIEMSQFTLPAKELMSDFPSLYLHALHNILLCSTATALIAKQMTMDRKEGPGGERGQDSQVGTH